MSDYFGALMRSSGLAVGGAAPAIMAPPASAPGPIEIDIEHSVPAMQPLPAPASQHETRPLSVAAASVEPWSGREPATPAMPPAAPSVHAEAAVNRPHDKAGHKEEVPTDAQPLVPPSSPSDRSTPAAQPQGHALVRAAMQWVAADPQQAIPGPQDETRRKPLAALDVAEMPVVRESTPTPTPMADAEQQAILPVQTPTPTPKSSVTRSVEAVEDAPRHPSHPATPMPVPAPFAPTPLPRDELVEISIGAIHLRVDAPATQTLARSLAPPAAAPHSTAPATTPRSALARRALRRI